jgi:hypothetical protein
MLSYYLSKQVLKSKTQFEGRVAYKSNHIFRNSVKLHETMSRFLTIVHDHMFKSHSHFYYNLRI